MSDTASNLDSVVVSITTELVHRFAGQVDAGIIADTVAQCAADFKGAAIATFVPIFLERRSRERIRTLTGPDMAPQS